MLPATPYPTTPVARDRFVLSRRPHRPLHDPWRHQGVMTEQEPVEAGRAIGSVTVLLTGRECPWRCAMCDLWQYTTAHDTPTGALPHQVAAALAALEPARIDVASPPTQIKLYNAGSFFDPRAVPEADYAAIAALVRPFGRVVVESHPRLVGQRLQRFIDARADAAAGGASAAVEVAMGIETAHPDALERLNKRVDVATFAAAARDVLAAGATLRAFVLVGVPFVPTEAQHEWVQRSIDAARASGARLISLIPTRPGNGALEALARTGEFVRPRFADLDAALTTALVRRAASAEPWPLVLADPWDLDALAECPACHGARVARLAAMNLSQQPLPSVACAACGLQEGAA